jgi:hypothetical protein
MFGRYDRHEVRRSEFLVHIYESSVLNCIEFGTEIYEVSTEIQTDGHTTT